MHINYLELLVAILAAKIFLNRSITAPRAKQYHSSGLHQQHVRQSLAKELWMRALNEDTAQHIPGVSDTVADMELQTVHDKSDWMLCL